MAKEKEDKSEAKDLNKLTVDDLGFESLEFGSDEEEDPKLEELDEQEELEEEEEDEDEDSDDDKDTKKKKKEEDPDTDDESDEDDEDDSEGEGEGDSDGEGEDDEEPSVVSTILDSIGLELSEEELEGVEDTEEGLAKLTDTVGRKLAEQRYNEMVESSPNVKALYDYEQTGGSPEDFMKAFYPSTDYNKVQVKEDDIDTQKEIIRQSLKAKGLSDERVNRNLEAIEDSGKLLEESKDSLTDLRQMQKQEQERIKEDTSKKMEEMQKQAAETWDKVEETIESGRIKNFPIPKTKSKDFKNFITVDPQTGQAPRDQKLAEMSLEDQLALDLVLYYGFDGLGELIDKKATSKGVKSLKDKLKSNKERGKNNSQDPDLNKGGKASVDDIVVKFD